jgi:hypothetical protein
MKLRHLLVASFAALALVSSARDARATFFDPRAELNRSRAACEVMGATTCFDISLLPPGRSGDPEAIFTTSTIGVTSLSNTVSEPGASQSGTASAEADFARLGAKATSEITGFDIGNSEAQAGFFDEFRFGAAPGAAILTVTANGDGVTIGGGTGSARIGMLDATSTFSIGGVLSFAGDTENPSFSRLDVTDKIAVKPGDLVLFELLLDASAVNDGSADFLDPLTVTSVSATDAIGNPIAFTLTDANGNSLVAPPTASAPEPENLELSALGIALLLFGRRSIRALRL